MTLNSSTLRLILVIGALLIVPSLASAQTGGPYDLTWSTIDGGGETFSTGGPISIGGTFGQADASDALAMTGGSYAIRGGFWPVAFCRADYNGDGSLDDFDYFDFLNDFFANSPAADYNLDGSTDDFDFFDFLNDFFAGC
ncbi:MAG: hypothetical protein JNM07_11120 [Phycisphaerae bacterium]|nr:hypothetical protein [Phycisphaerae bacterium]